MNLVYLTGISYRCINSVYGLTQDTIQSILFAITKKNTNPQISVF